MRDVTMDSPLLKKFYPKTKALGLDQFLTKLSKPKQKSKQLRLKALEE